MIVLKMLLEELLKMKKLFNKLTSGKKKTPSSSQDRGSSRSLNQSNDNIYDVREKDLGKIHKAVWQDDTAKAIQLAKKEVNALDKEKIQKQKEN